MFQCQLVVQATNRLIIQALRRGETIARRAELAQIVFIRDNQNVIVTLTGK